MSKYNFLAKRPNKDRLRKRIIDAAPKEIKSMILFPGMGGEDIVESSHKHTDDTKAFLIERVASVYRQINALWGSGGWYDGEKYNGRKFTCHHGQDEYIDFSKKIETPIDWMFYDVMGELTPLRLKAISTIPFNHSAKIGFTFTNTPRCYRYSFNKKLRGSKYLLNRMAHIRCADIQINFITAYESRIIIKYNHTIGLIQQIYNMLLKKGFRHTWLDYYEIYTDTGCPMLYIQFGL